MKKFNNLYKAATGGGTEQDQMYKQLTAAIYGAIKRGQSPDDVYAGLINQRINKDIASKLVSGVVEYMLSNGELEEEDLQQQKQQQAQEEQQRMQEQQMAQQDTIVDEWDENLGPESNDPYSQEMEQANQQSMDLVNEDAEDTEDLLGFQTGGQQALLDEYDTADDEINPAEVIDYSKLISSTPGVQNVNFPGIEEYYLPYNPLFTGEFELPDVETSQQETAKYGGQKTKRKFTNQVLKLLKKAEGGEGIQQPDEVLNSGKAQQTDDLTGSVKKVKSDFINAVSGEAKKVVVGNWFEKLKENNDPMLDQILNPAPKENPLEQKMQQDKMLQQELSSGKMKKGGSKRQYEKLAKKIYNQIANTIPIPKGFDVPVSYYDKRAPFVNQRFSTIGGPQINKYFEMLSKLYPQRANIDQITDVVNDPNIFNMLYPDPGHDGSLAPEGTMRDTTHDVSVAPIRWDASVQPQTNNGPFQYAIPGDSYETNNLLPESEGLNSNGGRTMQIGYSNPPTYMVYDANGKLLFSSKNQEAAQKVLKGGPGYQNGGEAAAEDPNGLYTSALNEYNYFLKNPAMWNEDPEMLNEDGSLNLCLDCINVDYANPKHVADAARLINEGYTRGTHANEKTFRDALKQFGIAEPIYKSTPIEQKQYGGLTGSKDPSVPALTRFVYGGDDEFPEESKNVNDPYFSDMTSYPQMQNGGDPTAYTHYTHGGDDIFHDQMNMMVKAVDGLEVPSNPYLEQLQQLLENSQYNPRDIRRAMRNKRRSAGNTYRDILFPANRAIEYSGSWAQQMGLPFLSSTGETYMGDMNGPLAKREVTKRGILGRPKEWTDYYMIGADGSFSSLDGTNTNKIILDPYKTTVAEDTKPIDKLDRQVRRWDRRAARNEEEYVPMEGAITNYENSDDYYNAVNPMSKEDAEFLGAGATSSDEYKNKGKVRQIRDAEGNWYDRDNKIIPDKQSPSEVPGYYDDMDKINKANMKSNPMMLNKYGGGLKRYVTGGEDDTPVSYTNNPAFAGMTEVDMTTNNAGNTGLQPSTFWANSQSFNAAPPSAPKEMQQQAAELTQYTVDPYQIEEHQAPKVFQGLVGVKRKRQDMTTIDPEAGVNTVNAGIRGVLGGIDRMRNRTQEADMYAENFDPTKVYGKKERMDTGDSDVNTGIYRTNQTGADRLGRSKKYGGYMQPGGFVESDMPTIPFAPEDNMIYPPGDNQYPMMPVNRDILDMLYNRYYSDPNFNPYNEEDYYMENDPEQMDIRMVEEGGETYMSEDQIKAYLAAGGEIEYL